jgi:hypothetical protein
MAGGGPWRDAHRMSAPLLISPAAGGGARVGAGPGVIGPHIVGLQDAAAVARERVGALPGVRVVGVHVGRAGQEHGVRLAIDVRDTGRDAWQVACALAARGIAVEAAAGRAFVLRLRVADVEEGTHERLAPALLQALWSVPARRGFELVLDAAPARPADARRTARA